MIKQIRFQVIILTLLSGLLAQVIGMTCYMAYCDIHYVEPTANQVMRRHVAVKPKRQEFNLPPREQWIPKFETRRQEDGTYRLAYTDRDEWVVRDDILTREAANRLRDDMQLIFETKYGMLVEFKKALQP